MNQRTEMHLKDLVTRRVSAAMKRHPRGSSAAVWAAREAIEKLCDGEGVSLHWSGPRKAHIHIDDLTFHVVIPAEFVQASA